MLLGLNPGCPVDSMHPLHVCCLPMTWGSIAIGALVDEADEQGAGHCKWLYSGFKMAAK